MGKSTNPITFIADVEIAQKLRVALKAGTTTTPPEVGIAGLGDPGVGINDVLVAADKDAAIEPYNKSGTLEMVADGAIALGGEVYPAAGGKCSATVAGEAIGRAIEAATADEDIIEVIPYQFVVDAVHVTGATIATTSTTVEYTIAPKAGKLVGVDFSPLVALAAHDTNYITWTITNLDQDGTGTTAMLAATDVNTTKATGGSALAVNTRRQLTLHGTAANLVVAEGDRIKITATASGTLANTVTVPVYMLKFA